MMHVKPMPGRVVREPGSNQPLPPEGREVPESSYWVRRLDDGDVVVVPPTPTTDTKAAT